MKGLVDNVISLSENPRDLITRVLKDGAKRMLAQAIEAEVKEYLSEVNRDEVIVSKNGKAPTRKIQTGLGPIEIERQKLRKKAGKAGKPFESKVLPRYLRKTKSLEELVPWLYLKGISTSDMSDALEPILGRDLKGFSASTVVGLKSKWAEEYKAWNLSNINDEIIYCWADGVYFDIRLGDDQRQCILVVIGATAKGEKKLLGIEAGYRESKLSWTALLTKLRDRGLTKPPQLAIGDGAMGFWAALDEIYPTTAHQRCWVHRTANVLDILPKSLQPQAKSMIHDIYQAESRAEADKAFKRFEETFEAKYPKAVAKLIDTPRHRNLAYEAALQSVVVLQNHDNLLPLNSSVPQKIGVIGPHALCRRELLSNYHGQRCAFSPGNASLDCFDHRNHDNDGCYMCLETPYHAIWQANSAPGSETSYAVGCGTHKTDWNEIDKACELAQNVDTLILLMGLDQSQEAEGRDRTITTLPGLQIELIQEVLKAKGDSTKVILVLLHGGSLSLGKTLIESIPTIVSASYGGQAGSQALADIIFGRYNPTGKLSSTMYPSSFVEQLPLTAMSLTEPPGRTYMYYEDEAEFEFGHGLSYSIWKLQWVRNSRAEDNRQDALHLYLPPSEVQSEVLDSDPRNEVTVSVQLSNLGPFSGNQTVLLFWEPVEVQSVPVDVTLPLRRLIDFRSAGGPLGAGSQQARHQE